MRTERPYENPGDRERTIEAIARRLARAERVFVLSGAGMGVGSGLTTFRSAGGYWGDRRVESLASRAGFLADPGIAWAWYNMRIAAYLKAVPNPGHDALARLARLVQVFTLATQNVDGLDARAGTPEVLELHGSIFDLKCTGCKEKTRIAGQFDTAEVQHGCGGLRRPGVVWFGESLPERAWNRAAVAGSRADVIIVAGTSGTVQPAAGLAQPFEKNALVIEINPQPTMKGTAGFVLAEGSETALPAIVEELRRVRERSANA